MGDAKTPSTYLLAGQPGQLPQGECSRGPQELIGGSRRPPAPGVLGGKDQLSEVGECPDTPKHPCLLGSIYGTEAPRDARRGSVGPRFTAFTLN